MKKSIFLMLVACLTASFAYAAENALSDTTFQYQNKTIELTDDNGQVDVKVFETSQTGDTVEYKSVYEGVFSDEKSFEKYTVLEDLGIQLPSLMKKNKRHVGKMEPHWSGFSFGFCNVVDDNNKIAAFDETGTKINADVSYEWALNLSEFIVPVYKDVFGFSTGFGLSWRNYYLEDDMYLKEVDNYIVTYPAPVGVNYKSSRLRTLHITLPVFLEWQPHFGNDHNIFFTAGVVGGLKTFANYKTVYLNSNGDKVKNTTAEGLNLPPLTLDYMVQAGYKDFSLFAKYSPMNFFREGEGPHMHTASIGFILHMN
jgi:hypothetical protein